MRRARWSPRSAWCGASCSCPGRACGAWRTSTPGCRTGAWSWPRNRTAARTRRSAACSPRTVPRCCRCPGSVSTSAAWRHMKADRYGVAAPGDGIAVPRTGRTRAGSRSWASARSRPGVLDSSGKHLATHPRAYGQASTSSEDPSMQLALLCNKPASWTNSRVRDALPDPLREWLDRQDRQTRNEAPRTLKRVDRESGWANAVEAMLSILESTGGADRAGVTLLAARLAEGVAGIECDDDRPDLSEYDIAFTADVGVQGGGRRARRRTKGSTRRPASCSSPRRASTSSPAGPRPARSTPSTACSTRNWPTGNARSTTGSCAAPGSPSSRASDGYDFTNAGLPDGYTPGRAPGTRLHPARAGPGVLRQDRARKDTSRDRAGHEGDRHGAGRAVPSDRRARAPGWARPNAMARSRRCSGTSAVPT